MSDARPATLWHNCISAVVVRSVPTDDDRSTSGGSASVSVGGARVGRCEALPLADAVGAHAVDVSCERVGFYVP